jgi:hypothetical protein
MAHHFPAQHCSDTSGTMLSDLTISRLRNTIRTATQHQVQAIRQNSIYTQLVAPRSCCNAKLLQRVGLSLFPKSDGDHKIPTGALGYRRYLQPGILFDHNDERDLFDVKYNTFDQHLGANRRNSFS